MTPRKVQIWFQNRRTKAKNKGLEMKTHQNQDLTALMAKQANQQSQQTQFQALFQQHQQFLQQLHSQQTAHQRLPPPSHLAVVTPIDINKQYAYGNTLLIFAAR